MNFRFKVVLAAVFTVGVFAYYLTSIHAAENKVIDTTSISTDSSIKETADTIMIDLRKDKGALYKSQKEGIRAAGEFVMNAPQYKSPLTQNISKNLLPADFYSNSSLVRYAEDKKDSYLTTKGFNLSGEHFYYQQKINDIPVYRAKLAVHVKNGKEVYSVNGNLVKNQATLPEKIDEGKAKTIALAEAQKQSENKEGLKIVETKKYVFNNKVLGLSADENNYVTMVVTVVSDKQVIDFAYKYFVDLTSGSIIYTEPLIIKALERAVYNCNHQTSCTLAREEGQVAVNDNDVDKTYDYLGNIYNYYYSSFQRDSYNGGGANLIALVHLPNLPDICPNAAWAGAPLYQMQICDGMVVNDIIAHEITHGVTESTANLIYHNQSGALNESISDIFAYAVDNDWTMGEDSILGVIRYLDDPTKVITGFLPQPDRLFSANYACLADDDAHDWGGVHVNSGVLNKAFYLMTAGGSFNSCTITGVGKEKSLPIIYRALTTYLTSSSNFKAAYNAINSACNDLYQAGSNTCIAVANALKATEMDQQPDSDQQGAKCTGKVAAAVQCVTGDGADVSPTPTPTGSATASPTPTTPASLPTPTTNPQAKLPKSGAIPSTGPFCPATTNCDKKTAGDANCDGNVNDTDFDFWKQQFDTFVPAGSVNNANFYCVEGDSSTYYVDLSDFEVWRRGWSTLIPSPTLTSARYFLFCRFKTVCHSLGRLHIFA